jgi:3-deoxy-D-manno-octulosonic-acid transferase
VATGPQVFNFAAILDLLVTEEAAVIVEDAEGLAALMIRWLTDAAERARIGENGRRVVAQNRGAMNRLIDLIEPRLRQATTAA